MKITNSIRGIDNKIMHVVCNKCAGTIFLLMENVQTGTFIDGTEIRAIFGFGSKLDTMAYEFDLCTKCFLKVTKRFKLPIKGKEYDL